jgi:mono/diheme cytochrome c family protein
MVNRRSLMTLFLHRNASSGALFYLAIHNAASRFTMKSRSLLLLSVFALAVGVWGTPDAVSAEDKLYTVVDGYKVDPKTLQGFRTWRQAACDRCHGANQEGLVGPSLVNSLKTLTKEDFVKTVRDGRLEKGMQSFGNNPVVMENIDNLYAYLKGRSDGAITRAKVEGIEQN